MAKCKECGADIIWAVIKNGKLADKNRPFDAEGSASRGKYGLKGTGEFDKYDQEKLSAEYFDDPVQGLEKYDKLHQNHFDVCGKGGPSGGNRTSGSGQVFVEIKFSGGVYSGTLSSKPRPKEDELF